MNNLVMSIDIGVYIGLTLLVNRIVAGFFTPIIERLKIGKFWLMYVSWVSAACIIFATGLNLFEPIITISIVGQVLTAIAVGGGANILHDYSDNKTSLVDLKAGENSNTHDQTDR